MPRPHLLRPRLLAIAAAALLALPAAASAAGTIDLTGTVTRDGAPVAGASVTALLDGTDMIVAATTDGAGAFVLQLEGDIGGVVQVRATGPTVTLPPDEQGCVRSETPTGRATVTIDALPVPLVAVPLDTLLVSSVCSATARPDPAATLPATDTTRPGQGGRDAGPGSAWSPPWPVSPRGAGADGRTRAPRRLRPRAPGALRSPSARGQAGATPRSAHG
jgi:hypothetical protein